MHEGPLLQPQAGPAAFLPVLGLLSGCDQHRPQGVEWFRHHSRPRGHLQPSGPMPRLHLTLVRALKTGTAASKPSPACGHGYKALCYGFGLLTGKAFA